MILIGCHYKGSSTLSESEFFSFAFALAPIWTFTLTDTEDETETNKNGLYRIVQGCSHCSETLTPLNTAAIYWSLSRYLSRSLLVWMYHNRDLSNTYEGQFRVYFSRWFPRSLRFTTRVEWTTCTGCRESSPESSAPSSSVSLTKTNTVTGIKPLGCFFLISRVRVWVADLSFAKGHLYSPCQGWLSLFVCVMGWLNRLKFIGKTNRLTKMLIFTILASFVCFFNFPDRNLIILYKITWKLPFRVR